MHQGIAFRIAYLVAGDERDAEEAAQDAFVKAFRALGRFRRGAPFRPWLLEIVSNEARNRRRSAARHARIALRSASSAAAEDRPGDAAPSPEAALLDAEAPAGAARRDRTAARGGAARARLPLLPRPLRGRDGGGARDPSRHREVAPRAGARPPARAGGASPVAEAAVSSARCASSARELVFPPEPDLAARSARRLRAEPAPRRGYSFARRPLAIALAVLALAVAAAFAVPRTRAAILDLLGIGGVTIERVETLPDGRGARLGRARRAGLARRGRGGGRLRRVREPDELRRRLPRPLLPRRLGLVRLARRPRRC